MYSLVLLLAAAAVASGALEKGYRTHSSFCGETAVPFSFGADSHGNPVLGCARPMCFVWLSKERAPRFTSSTRRNLLKRNPVNCEWDYSSRQCHQKSQWVGGLSFTSFQNVSRGPLKVRCCEYRPLELSEDRGIVVVRPNQNVIGGHVSSGTRQFGFDYISDLVRHVDGDGAVSFTVSMRRMPCLPPSFEKVVSVKQGVEDVILDNFGRNSGRRELQTGLNRKAYQAPLHAADGDVAGVVPLRSTSRILPPVVEENEVHVGEEPADLSPIDEERRQTPPQAGVEAESSAPTPQSEAKIDPSGQTRVETEPSQPSQQKVQFNGNLMPLPSSNGFNQFMQPFSGYSPQNSPYYPVAASGGVPNCGLYCFSADTVVRTLAGGSKRMDELKVNDWVLTAGRNGKTGFYQVTSWIHKMPDQVAEFLQFTLEDGKSLKMTGKHFIYRAPCSSQSDKPVPIEDTFEDMVFADQVRVGDCLFVYQNRTLVERRVVEIRAVLEKGLYAPMTSNSHIIVNDVHASCYNLIRNPQIQTTFTPWLNWLGATFFEWFEETQQVDLVPGMHLLVQLIMHVTRGPI